MSYLHELHHAAMARRAKFFPPQRCLKVPEPEPVHDPAPEPAPEPVREPVEEHKDAFKLIPRHIAIFVANRYGVKPFDLRDRPRQQKIVLPRHIAIYAARAVTGFSLSQIGKVFRRDHTTILHACEKIGAMVRRDAGFAHEVAELIEDIKTEAA